MIALMPRQQRKIHDDVIFIPYQKMMVPLLFLGVFITSTTERYGVSAFSNPTQQCHPLSNNQRQIRSSVTDKMISTRSRKRIIRALFLEEGTSFFLPTLSSSSSLMAAVPSLLGDNFQFLLPFEGTAKNLFDQLDIGAALSQSSGNSPIPESATIMVLESVGHDLLVFLVASVIITPLFTTLKISPILGYLLAGAALGPYGGNVFSNSQADIELGDFGILFLLFSEGLEVSSMRIKQLTNYVPLGLAQLSLTTGVLTAALLLGGPEYLERVLPLDASLINIHNPKEALVLALAGTLSTSAFIFPVLKTLKWDEESSGQAATSILLLQDLAVAPLLVILPYMVSSSAAGGVEVSAQDDIAAIAFLTIKATLGFGSVIYVGSLVLRRVFQLVARTQSTETFVALCLLVSVGIGEIAKTLGLTDTAGAFAAGVLLANTNYRAQIQADILPFKGILLGIFFMDAGSSFDWRFVYTEWPTVLTGVVALILLKAVTLLAATRVPLWMEPNRLPTLDAIRLALLLSGGGEFAFVVLALAAKLQVLPLELVKLLTAVVLITMAVTPLLGELALHITQDMPRQPPIIEVDVERMAAPMQQTLKNNEMKTITEDATTTIVAEVDSNAIVVSGYGEVGQSLFQVLANAQKSSTSGIIDGKPGDDNTMIKTSKKITKEKKLPNIVAFDMDESAILSSSATSPTATIVFGDGSNPAVLRSSGIVSPQAIFITYLDHYQVRDAACRLRDAFPDSPIFARATTQKEATHLIEEVGVNEVVVESFEFSRWAIPLLQGQRQKLSSLESSNNINNNKMLLLPQKKKNMIVSDEERDSIEEQGEWEGASL